MYNGTKTAIIVGMSDVGVIKAASIKITTMACLLYLRINAGVIMPIRLIKYTTTGISNTKPNARVKVVRLDTYESNEIKFFTSPLTAYGAKKFHVNGNTKK